MQAEPDYRDDPEDFSKIYVKSTTGESIPLSAVATARYVSGPNVLPRFNAFPAAKITGAPAPGYSSGQALAAMEALADQCMADYDENGWTDPGYHNGGDISVLSNLQPEKS